MGSATITVMGFQNLSESLISIVMKKQKFLSYKANMKFQKSCNAEDTQYESELELKKYLANIEILDLIDAKQMQRTSNKR